MSFDERNAKWKGSAREFLQVNARSAAPRVWRVEVKKDKVLTVWGLLGGAMQQAEETLLPLNVGKSNEKSASQVALERGQRLSLLKYREGYREYDNGKALDVAETEIDFDNLPGNLCFYKPDNSMGAGITKLAEEGKAWYARKANGLMFVIAKGKGGANLYSRKMLRYNDKEVGQKDKSWDRRFANIAGVADFLMPANSILLGELVCRHRETGEEDFAGIQTLTKCLTDRAFTELVLFEDKNFQPVFYVWDVAFWNGQDLLSTMPVKTRYELIHDIIEGPHLHPVEFYDSKKFKMPSDAIDFAKKNKYEGFVVVDPEGIYGDKAYNFKGKPDRPGTACAKLKPAFEDDFIAMWDPAKGIGEKSTKASNDQGIKSVALFQYNSKGELIFISNVSSGLSKEQIWEWSDPRKFPMVWKVEYTDRTYVSDGDKTNALTFGRFIEVRTDKKPEECVNDRL